MTGQAGNPTAALALPGAAVSTPLWLDGLDNTLGGTRRMRLPRQIVGATLALLVALVLWASWAPVDTVVRTQGRVVSSVKPQLVQHLEGGIVSKVYAREGDVVERGAPLVAVADTMANATRGEKRARLAGLVARTARLAAEAEGAARMVLPKGIEADAAEVREERQAFEARREKLLQTARVLQEQATQKRQEADELKARRKGLEAEAEVARQQLALVSAMIARNAGSQLELLDARARLERLSTQIREADSAMPRLASAAQELLARQQELQASFRSDARSALTDARVELQRMHEDLKTDDDRVRRTLVTAPVAGTVNKMLANTVGGVIRPGETLLELTPADGALVIESRATPAERGSLQVGQRAVVRVSAFDYTVYGTLPAEITEISADSLSDERGERFFRVTLQVDEVSRRAFGQPLTPGSTVTTDLVTGQRTVGQYLLSPVRGLWANAFRDRH